MYKILVVDDEKLIRNGIISKIKYHKFSFDEILQSHDGIDAVEKIKNNHIDIVIADIRMPGLNGLEMIKLAKTIKPEIKFIVISGYAEFEYAKQAINIGAIGYILKPIGDNELVDMLNKAIYQLDKENNLLEISSRNSELKKYCQTIECEQRLNQIFHQIKVTKSSIPDEKIIAIPEEFDCFLSIIHIDHASYTTSLFNERDTELMKFAIINILDEYMDQYKKIIANNNKNKNQLFMLIIYPAKDVSNAEINNLLSKIHHVLKCYLEISITIGISQPSESVSNNLYTQAKQALDMRIIYGNDKIYQYGNVPTMENISLPYNQLNLLKNCIGNFDIDNTLPLLKQIFSKENIQGKSAEFIYFLWLEIINMIIKVFPDSINTINKNIDISLMSREILDKFDNIDEIISYLYTTIADIMDIQKPLDTNCKDRIILIQEYIENHFQDDLSVNEIAYSFAINPNYLSTIFKEETGKTVIDYITATRMKNACMLLSKTKARVTDISKSIGYNDPQYFFRVFKKNIGMTPLEYREKHFDKV